MRLKESGFDVEVRGRARPNNKGPRHTIWFAESASLTLLRAHEVHLPTGTPFIRRMLYPEQWK